MDLSESRYQVGQRLQHPVFGEGLIVEVHTDRGREVLEVVFDGQLRRLSAQRDWVIVDGADPVPVAAATDGGVPGEAPAPVARRNWHPQGDALLERWLGHHAEPQSHFDLRAEAEAWAGWASADKLISLDSLRGVERFPHQVAACLKVLRDYGGRAILADEVGLARPSRPASSSRSTCSAVRCAHLGLRHLSLPPGSPGSPSNCSTPTPISPTAKL